jgi:hypothetical protein
LPAIAESHLVAETAATQKEILVVLVQHGFILGLSIALCESYLCVQSGRRPETGWAPLLYNQPTWSASKPSGSCRFGALHQFRVAGFRIYLIRQVNLWEVDIRAPGVHRPAHTPGRMGTAWLRRASPARRRVRVAAFVHGGRPGSSRRFWPGPCQMKMGLCQTFQLRFFGANASSASMTTGMCV